jgi:hypothetical protein
MTKVDEHADETRPAASWYLDPLKRHQHRDWNGSTWTGDVGDDGIQSNDPLVVEDSNPSVGAPTATMVAGREAPTVAPPADKGTAPKKVKRAWNQKMVGPLVVFAVGAIVVGGVAGIGAIGGGGSTSSRSGRLNNSVALATAIQASGSNAPGVDKPMTNVVCKTKVAASSPAGAIPQTTRCRPSW